MKRLICILCCWVWVVAAMADPQLQIEVENDSLAQVVDQVSTSTIFVVTTQGDTIPLTLSGDGIEPVATAPWHWLLVALLLVAVFFSGVITYSIVTQVQQQQKKALAEKQLADMKLRFFTNISHELRTPLTLILGPVETILSGEPVSPSVRSQLEIVSSNAKRMLRMVNQILDYRQLNNGKLRLQVQQVELAGLVASTCANFEREAADRQIAFSLENDVPQAQVWVDPDKMEIIIFNLLSNAFKYTPSGKSISVKVYEKKDFVCVQIADTGVGIPGDKRSVLFERFSSHNEINKNLTDRAGTGIGLNMVKELIDLHRGYIAVESEVGVGTTFRIMLRHGRDHFGNDVDLIIGDAGVVTNVQPLDAPLGEPDFRQMVLVVDDNADMRTFLQTVLIDRFHVVLAEDGEEALKKAYEFLPDLIVSDLMMPNMDGLELTDQIKNNAALSHIPLILLTAKSAIESRLEALRYGADDYLTKPFSPEYLVARIDNLLSQRKRLQETYRNSFLRAKSSVAQPQEDLTPDERFLKTLLEYMEQHIDNSDLTVDELVSHMALGRTVFFNKLKSLTGLSPVEFIREVRIKRAAVLLEDESKNITEVTYAIGFNDSRYFSKCFKAVYGVTPSEYRRACQKKQQQHETIVQA